METPPGWQFELPDETSIVLASEQDDLTAETPQGPRLTITQVSAVGANAEVAPETLSPPSFGFVTAVDVIEESDLVEVAGETGVSFTLQLGDRIQRSVLVFLADGGDYIFTFEAPVDRWEASQDAFDALLASVSFAVEPQS